MSDQRNNATNCLCEMIFKRELSVDSYDDTKVKAFPSLWEYVKIG